MEMKKKNFNEMVRYEQEIAFNLTKLGYEKDCSIKILEEYYSVMSIIGWDRTPKQWAKELNDIYKGGISPKEWLKHIESFVGAPLDPFNDSAN